MNHENVHITVLPEGKCLPGADCDPLQLNPCVLQKNGSQVIEEARVVRARGCGHMENQISREPNNGHK